MKLNKTLILVLFFTGSIKCEWAEKTLNQLTLEQKIGQMFFIGVDNSDFVKMDEMPDEVQARIINTNKRELFNKKLAEELINKYNIGGIHLIGFGSLKSCFDSIQYFQSISSIPLLFSQDFEWGLTMRLHDAFRFPKNMTLGAIEIHNTDLIYQVGKEIGRQCALLGVHINFAPVVDVNSNPNNPIIGERSFGSDRDNVALKGAWFMKGLQDSGIIACAKHFCGHGDTRTDSHHDLPIINHPMERLGLIELYPFRRIINAGVKAIMSAHIHVPAIDSRTNRSLTLSQRAMTDLLQNDLNFKGLIITDALDMQGIIKYFEPGQAELEAFLAGNDVLLMSLNVIKSIEMIKKHIQGNPASEKELDRRVLKILKLKEDLNLHNNKIKSEFDFNKFHTQEAKDLKRKIYESAITLINYNKKALNVEKNSKIAVIAISNSNAYNNASFYEQLKKYYSLTDYFSINSNDSQEKFTELFNKIKNYKTIIINQFDTNRFEHLNYGLSDNNMIFLAMFESLKENEPIIVLFGSPYSLKKFKHFKNIIMAYEDDKEAQIAAANVIANELPAIGRLPINL